MTWNLLCGPGWPGSNQDPPASVCLPSTRISVIFGRCNFFLVSWINQIMSHIHVGPDVKKKTEEEDVECEADLIVEYQPKNAVQTLDFNISEHVPGTVFLTSSPGGDISRET